MVKETITYRDYNDVERTEDFYFHLTKAELMEMEVGVTGGYTEMLKKIIAAQDTPTLMRVFKEFVIKAYGEKSADGRRFMKTPEITAAFIETEAYSQLFMKLALDADYASKFFNKVVPKEVEEEAAKLALEQKN